MTTPSKPAVRYVSYWETAPGKSMPPYVALAIVSMQRALGDAFHLLTPKALPGLIDADIVHRHWDFQPLAFHMDRAVRAIVAKSDVIRLAYVHRHGGVWLDADTLLFRDPTASLFPNGLTDKLHWYSEALFGTRPGHPLLGQAVAAALAQGDHAWADPGGIKALVTAAPSQLEPISDSLLDPGYRPRYSFSTCDVMRRRDIAVDQFLLDPKVDILKLYNTYFTRTSSALPTVETFLAGGTLLARLFLHIEPDASWWIERTDALIARCGA